MPARAAAAAASSPEGKTAGSHVAATGSPYPRSTGQSPCEAVPRRQPAAGSLPGAGARAKWPPTRATGARAKGRAAARATAPGPFPAAGLVTVVRSACIAHLASGRRARRPARPRPLRPRRRHARCCVGRRPVPGRHAPASAHASAPSRRRVCAATGSTVPAAAAVVGAPRSSAAARAPAPGAGNALEPGRRPPRASPRMLAALPAPCCPRAGPAMCRRDQVALRSRQSAPTPSPRVRGAAPRSPRIPLITRAR